MRVCLMKIRNESTQLLSLAQRAVTGALWNDC